MDTTGGTLRFQGTAVENHCNTAIDKTAGCRHTMYAPDIVERMTLMNDKLTFRTSDVIF